MITERENYLRAVEFRYPEWIPCRVYVSYAAWKRHREKIQDLFYRYPKLFKNAGELQKIGNDFPPVYKEGEYFRDNWGCLWYTAKDGYEGQIVEHPLSDWKKLKTYKPPDFLTKTERGERDWEKIKKDIEQQRKQGLLVNGDGERLFDRLYFLRGFENLMIDIMTDNPNLLRLIDMLLDYEMKLVKKWLEIGVDVISFHSDMGTQNGLMISPAKFRKYIKPMFKEIFLTCRNVGAHVYFSSEGRLLDIVDDLIECGVSVHNPQIRANTLKGIEKYYKGRLCIDIDLDRQMFPFCSPEDVKRHVKETVEALSLPEGGLMVWGWIADDVPFENIKALCEALDEFCLRGI